MKLITLEGLDRDGADFVIPMPLRDPGRALRGSYPTVAAIALIMTAVTAAGVMVAVAVAGSDVFEKLEPKPGESS